MALSVNNMNTEDAGISESDGGRIAVFGSLSKDPLYGEPLDGDRVQVQQRRHGLGPFYARLGDLPGGLSDFNVIAGTMTNIQPDEKNLQAVYLNSAIPSGTTNMQTNNRQSLDQAIRILSTIGTYELAELLI